MPAIGGAQSVAIQLLDYSGERSAVTAPVGELTAISLPGFLTELSAWQAALDAVTFGTISKVVWGATDVISNTRPSTKSAQVETQMLVTYQDAVTQQPFSLRIPTINYGVFNYSDPPAGDVVILSGAGASQQTLDFVTAAQNLWKSPANDANDIIITGMRVV